MIGDVWLFSASELVEKKAQSRETDLSQLISSGGYSFNYATMVVHEVLVKLVKTCVYRHSLGGE